MSQQRPKHDGERLRGKLLPLALLSCSCCLLLPGAAVLLRLPENAVELILLSFLVGVLILSLLIVTVLVQISHARDGARHPTKTPTVNAIPLIAMLTVIFFSWIGMGSFVSEYLAG
ncbi:hypothetical protein [Lacipirellula sp.]|uniref:hypothetical protein n=1 Tax=Lacipirellula sp. TaxID=2691419 RepID=UPI003D0BE819